MYFLLKSSSRSEISQKLKIIDYFDENINRNTIASTQKF